MPEKALTKTQFLQEVAEATGLTRSVVSGVYDAMQETIKRQLGRRGPGVVSLPGLIKIEKKRMPARAARKGVPNPFKPGELMDVPAKPATTKIKVRPLKNLKEMA